MLAMYTWLPLVCCGVCLICLIFLRLFCCIDVDEAIPGHRMHLTDEIIDYSIIVSMLCLLSSLSAACAQ